MYGGGLRKVKYIKKLAKVSAEIRNSVLKAIYINDKGLERRGGRAPKQLRSWANELTYDLLTAERLSKDDAQWFVKYFTGCALDKERSDALRTDAFEMLCNLELYFHANGETGWEIPNAKWIIDLETEIAWCLRWIYLHEDPDTFPIEWWTMFENVKDESPGLFGKQPESEEDEEDA